MSWSPDAPYNNLPPLPPEQELETKPVLRALVAARPELSALSEAIDSLRNPGKFVHALALLEAQASSEIENIVTTVDELFRADTHPAEASTATRQALRCRDALFHGHEQMRENADWITVGMTAAICSDIRGTPTDLRQGDRTYIGNPFTRTRIYTPPAGRDVIESKLQNWEQFVNADTDLDPLVQMAVAHYQFEAIHPFHDGNGRTGRIFNMLMLISTGLLQVPIMPISQYIVQRRREYYRQLNAVTKNSAWEEWILFMLHAVGVTARSARLKIRALQQLQDQVAEEMASGSGPRYPVGLPEVLFERPYCRVSDVVEGCGVSRPTATKYLNALVAMDVLDVQRAGRVNLFVNVELMRILRDAHVGP